MMQTEVLLGPVMLGFLLFATCEDLLERRIPNRLVAWGIGVALTLAAVGGGAPALATAVSGMLLGGLLLLPFYILGGMGAGDVKLMAMAGAFLGPAATVVALLGTLAAGFVLAITVLAFSAMATSNPGLQTVAALRRHLPAGLRPGWPGSKPTHLPYAAAILLGCAGALIFPITSG